MSITTFYDIIAWQKAHEMAKEIYVITKRFPYEEKNGLVSQMRRCAVSVPSNIVEGFSRRGVKDSLRFYNQAVASLKELEYQLLLSYELKFCLTADYRQTTDLIQETGRVLYGWMAGHHE